MNKLDANSPVFTLSPSSYEAEVDRRLIVLVPDFDMDISSAARKIWELANALGSRVQFLGLYKDEAREPSLRRRMIAMSSMVGGESKIEFGGDWLNFVKSNWREGDMIVCFAEHRAGFAQRPLSRILESNLNATIYMISDLQLEHLRPNRIFSAIGWAGSIAIIALFFFGQAKLVHRQQDWAHTALLYLSIFAEMGSIWAWNSLFG